VDRVNGSPTWDSWDADVQERIGRKPRCRGSRRPGRRGPCPARGRARGGANPLTSDQTAPSF